MLCRNTKYTFITEKGRSFSVVVVVVVAESFFLDCHWMASLHKVLYPPKVCVVHSTELTLLKCSEFQTSCILTFGLGCRSDAFIRWFISRLHTIQCDPDIKTVPTVCIALTTIKILSAILLFIHSKRIRFQYIWRKWCESNVIHNHFEWIVRRTSNATASRFTLFPYFVFIPFSRLCAHWTQNRNAF